MAEFIMKKMLRTAGFEKVFEIASAGTSDEELGNPVYPMARQELAKHGIGCPGKTARRITPEDYNHFDLIIGMDAADLKNMRQVYCGDPDGKLSLLLDHTPESDTKHHGRDVVDPWYTRKFNVAWEDIHAGCEAIFEKVTADITPTEENIS